MTNEEINNIKQKVKEIQRSHPSGEQLQQIEDIAKCIGASLPENLHTNDPLSRKNINYIATNIHIVLQTEMMLNACVSAEKSSELAKRSCHWAAVAAIAACIGAFFAGWPSIHHALVWLF